MSKIALIGYGKMGKAIEEVALQRNHEIVLKIDESSLDDFTEENIKKADVAIEFTSPHSAFNNIQKVLGFGIPVVSGSTGWLNKKFEIDDYVKEHNGSFLYASNFSVGVNLFFELNNYLARLMAPHPSYDVRIEEIHHTEKKDAPSGTAITLAEEVINHIKSKSDWVNNDPTKASQLHIDSIRQDPAPGTHTIVYSSQIDNIEIKHTAHNRKGFATGAVLAAEYIADKKGIFTMKEVLGLSGL